MSFSLEDLKMLAAIERQMDAGEVPWVRVDGISGRCAVSERILVTLDLRQGQTVSFALWSEILRLSLKFCEEDLAAEVAANTARLEDEIAEGGVR